jgi:hypothetical protein
VKLESDADLDIGVFGIATRLVRGPGSQAPEGAPAEQPAPGATMVYKAVVQPEGVSAVGTEEARHGGVLTFAGQRHELDGERAVLGRSKDCDIQVSDPNVSRRHAEVRRDGNSYTLVDLDSTNGVEVDGKRVKRLELHDGSRFTIGSTEIVFSEELS